MSANLDRHRFLELQFITLRKEIEVSKKNMFNLVVGGAAVIPTAHSLASTYSIGALTLALPLVVAVLVLLFLVENHSMMRAGTYILEQIEPNIENVTGWETWLNAAKDGGNRTVDKLLVAAFAILTASYFIATVVLAVRHASTEFGEHGQYLAGVAYTIFGFAFAFILYSHAQTNTKSSE